MWKAVITLCVFRKKNLDFLTILGYILKNCFKVISPKNRYSKMTSTFLGFIFGTDFFSWSVWLTNCNCKLRAGFFPMSLWSRPLPGFLPAQGELSILLLWAPWALFVVLYLSVIWMCSETDVVSRRPCHRVCISLPHPNLFSLSARKQTNMKKENSA